MKSYGVLIRKNEHLLSIFEDASFQFGRQVLSQVRRCIKVSNMDSEFMSFNQHELSHWCSGLVLRYPITWVRESAGKIILLIAFSNQRAFSRKYLKKVHDSNTPSPQKKF